MTIRALIVEDEAVPARDLADIIMRLGYRVCGVAGDYETAVSIAHREIPDIALLDIRLRGERTGLDVADYLRRHFRLPLIFLTSQSDKDTAARARLLKANGFIVKPFTENIVCAAMENAFEDYIQEAANEETAPAARGPAPAGLAPIGLAPTGLAPIGLAPNVERQIRDYIESHIHAELRLDALAQIAGMSRFQFACVFRVSFGGVTPHRYIIQRRVAKASQLLRDTDRSIVEVGREVGYENESYFTTLFKRETGHTPKAFRGRFGGGASTS